MSNNRSQAPSPNSEDGPEYAGGDGSTPEEAIIIKNVDSHVAGVRAEKEYLADRYGIQDLDWEMKMQTLKELDDDTRLDEIIIEKASGEEETLYFDVSNFFGMDLE